MAGRMKRNGPYAAIFSPYALRRTVVRLRPIRLQIPSTYNASLHATGRLHAEQYHLRERGSGLHRMYTPTPIEEERLPERPPKEHEPFSSRFEFRAVFLVNRPTPKGWSSLVHRSSRFGYCPSRPS